ncbi:MAG: MoxR family ATPase [Mastigocoleus sp. MO_167.B18]|nr:MoxR family ATPase [Mastigocoleus sp. MO_167.B18]
MTDWKIFQPGNPDPHDDIENLPPPPSWREYSNDDKSTKKKRGAKFQAREEEINLVNAALYLRRPLLVTGKPGTGKTSLAYAVAYQLKLGEVLYWPITTRTTLKDGLYSYDAIARLQDTSLPGTNHSNNSNEISDRETPQSSTNNSNNLNDIGKYIQLGPLGTALLPSKSGSKRPRALLIDEIDKSDIDLPNDLLHVFEEGQFEIPELVRITEKCKTVEVRTAYKDKTEYTYQDIKTTIYQGRIQCDNFPFVILTSNGERDFPPAFLRRCLRLDIKEPKKEELEKIVKAHFLDENDQKAVVEGKLSEKAEELIKEFIEKRDKQQDNLATDQLLNAIYLITRKYAPEGTEKDDLIKELLKSLNP